MIFWSITLISLSKRWIKLIVVCISKAVALLDEPIDLAANCFNSMALSLRYLPLEYFINRLISLVKWQSAMSLAVGNFKSKFCIDFWCRDQTKSDNSGKRIVTKRTNDCFNLLRWLTIRWRNLVSDFSSIIWYD